jgi:predicted component of type VI protein secretion system
MRRFVLLYILIALSVMVMAQPRFSSNKETYDFGQIEWKHPVTVQYIVTNTGNEPLVLTEVEPSCACAVVQWTKEPIAPGERGMISVKFDAEALGHFNKSVIVYSNATPHLAYLNFTGEVVTEVKDYTRLYPFVFGQIRVDKNMLDFPDIYRGDHAVEKIGVVNLSDKPYEPVLMHLPPYLEMQAKPETLQKGEKGEITVTLKAEKLPDFGLTQTSVYLARFSGDKVNEENEMPFSVILLPDFSGLTETEKVNAPAVRFSKTDIDMSAVLEKKKTAKEDILITNTGKSPLHVNKLQVFNPAVGVSLKKNHLLPGESAVLRVMVDKKNITRKRGHLRILVITNDPIQPKTEINIKAK